MFIDECNADWFSKKQFSDSELITEKKPLEKDESSEKSICCYDANSLNEIFNLLKSEENLTLWHKIKDGLTSEGILFDKDPRLAELRNYISILKAANSFSELKVTKEQLKKILSTNKIIPNTLLRNLAFPEFEITTKIIEDIFIDVSKIDDGKVSPFIPDFCRTSPNDWGMSLCTIDGQCYHLGDYLTKFGLQACSKPLTYGLALDLLGEQVVHQFMGLEPTNLEYNSIELGSDDKPQNPLLNSGGLVICSLILSKALKAYSEAQKHNYIIEYLQKYTAGFYCEFKNAICSAEREFGDRNRAIAYCIEAKGGFPESDYVEDFLNFYFEMHSMEVNCESLAIIGATLANGGLNPFTDERVLSPDSVKCVLSVMRSCGMYNYSGEFGFLIGLPAKACIAGAIMLVVPGLLSIALYSPKLDTKNNSLKGLEFCKKLLKEFCFHPFDSLNISRKCEFPLQKIMKLICPVYCDWFNAAADDDLKTVSKMYRNDMNATVTNSTGHNILHVAVVRKAKFVINFLLEKCPFLVQATDIYGFTPLDYVEMVSDSEIIKIFKEKSF